MRTAWRAAAALARTPARAGVWLLPLLLASACTSLAAEPLPTSASPAGRGQRVFQTHCSRCHANSGDGVVVGPSLAGIATRGASRIAGLDAEAYIRDSIRNPRGYTVDGFPNNLMPVDIADQVGEANLDDLVAYLLTLR